MWSGLRKQVEEKSLRHWWWTLGYRLSHSLSHCVTFNLRLKREVYLRLLAFNHWSHIMTMHATCWLVVWFNVSSTAWSSRDGTPIYCPLRRTWSSINTPFRPGIEPRAVAWQSIALPLCYASTTMHATVVLKSFFSAVTVEDHALQVLMPKSGTV